MPWKLLYNHLLTEINKLQEIEKSMESESKRDRCSQRLNQDDTLFTAVGTNKQHVLIVFSELESTSILLVVL